MEITRGDTVERESEQLLECVHGGPPTRDGAKLTPPPEGAKECLNAGCESIGDMDL